jgi:predicted enzyme related to lactoylglutathione lyase
LTSAVQAWAWHHTGLSVNSLTRALDFYRESFGFYPVFEALDMSDLIQSVTGVAGLRADLVQCKSKISEQVLELIEFRNIPSDAEINLPIHPGIAHNAFLVPDLETAIAEIQKQGGKLLGQITDFSEGRAVYCRDASGCFLELEEASHEESA